MLIEEMMPEIRTATKNAFNAAGMFTAEDICNHIPVRYKDYTVVYNCLDDAPTDSFTAVKGRFTNYMKDGKAKLKRWEGTVKDAEGNTLKVMLWGNIYKARGYQMLKGEDVIVCGKLTFHRYFGYQMTSPDIFVSTSDFIPRIMPVYKKVRRVSEETFNSILKKSMRTIKEIYPENLIRKGDTIDYKTALSNVHFPSCPSDIESGKKRLYFNDFYYFSSNVYGNISYNDKGIKLENTALTEAFIKGQSFTLTGDQKKVLGKITGNMKRGVRCDVLLQGDVGCGKSIVAYSLLVLAAENGFQGALIAPTMVLAKQHYDNLTAEMEKTGVNMRISFLHAGLTAKRKRDTLKAIKEGRTDIVIGTHSVLSSEVEFDSLAVIITDEEHKFGVDQKESLKEKGDNGAHVISMSATPIPRSLAGIYYGDNKKIMQIKTMPEGRIPIKTAVQRTHKNAFPFMEKEIKNGHQCYVICPAISDPSSEDEDAVRIKSIETVKKEYDRYFIPKGVSIGVIHGRMKKQEIEDTIKRFSKNELQILISTTVIEVGVNVPNATVMVIEQAERFGLASLHQLRGRVGRGAYESYCILINDDIENKRLTIMTEETDGFVIAEEDLKLRGTGELAGTKQTGQDKILEEIFECPEYFEKVKKIAIQELKKTARKEQEST